MFQGGEVKLKYFNYKYLRVKREKEVIEKLEEETLLEIERRLDRETEKAAIKTEQILSLIVSSFFISVARN